MQMWSLDDIRLDQRAVCNLGNRKYLLLPGWEICLVDAEERYFGDARKINEEVEIVRTKIRRLIRLAPYWRFT